MTQPSKTFVILASLLTFTVTIIGCSVEKQFKDMQNTTAHMDQTTTHMDQTEDTLAKSSDALKSSMSHVFDMGRQGDSMDDRRKLLLESLKNADGMGTKFGIAVLYFMTFEYQLWTNGAVPDDTEARNHKLKDDATSEFFAMINEFWQNGDQVNPMGRKLADMVVDEKAENFNALAGALDYINREQLEMLANHPELKPVTMLSIIEDALADEPYVNSGRKLFRNVSLAEQTVQANHEVAIKLLQARQAFLPLLVLAKISPLGLETPPSGIKAFEFLANLNSVKKPWVLDITGMGVSKISDASNYLAGAQSTRQFLMSLNPPVMPQNDSFVKTAWDNADVRFDKTIIINTNGTNISMVKSTFASLVSLEKQFHDQEK